MLCLCRNSKPVTVSMSYMHRISGLDYFISSSVSVLGARQMRRRVEMNIEGFVRELRVPTALSGWKHPKARLVAPLYGVYAYAR